MAINFNYEYFVSLLIMFTLIKTKNNTFTFLQAKKKDAVN